jgi:hypothetical protein
MLRSRCCPATWWPIRSVGSVTIYSVEEVDGTLFLAMALLEGTSLRVEVMERGAWTGRTAFLELAAPLGAVAGAPQARGITLATSSDRT